MYLDFIMVIENFIDVDSVLIFVAHDHLNLFFELVVLGVVVF